MPTPRNPNDLSREEDYRDYEERDLDSGWPYGDGEGKRGPAKPDNGAYGASDTSFDTDSNEGFRVVDVDADGDQERLIDRGVPASIGLEDSDDIEERVSNALTLIDDIDIDSIEVRVVGTTVHLEGNVDTDELSRRAELTALKIAGVHKVRNELQVIGVDANMPEDD